jgi:hypothetical protein
LCEHDRCRHGDERGSEVSPGSLRQDQLVEGEIGNRLAKPLVLFLKLFQLTEAAQALIARNRPSELSGNPLITPCAVDYKFRS